MEWVSIFIILMFFLNIACLLICARGIAMLRQNQTMLNRNDQKLYDKLSELERKVGTQVSLDNAAGGVYLYKSEHGGVRGKG